MLVVLGVCDLLDDVCIVLLVLGEYELVECEVGLCLMIFDNLLLV